MMTYKTFEEKNIDARNKLTVIFPLKEERGGAYMEIVKMLNSFEKLYRSTKKNKVDLSPFDSSCEEVFAVIDRLYVQRCEQFGYDPKALSIILRMKK